MHRAIVRSALLIVIASVMLATDAEAQWTRQYDPVGQVRFRFGIFEPAGESSGWDRVFQGFTGRPGDLQDFSWGTDLLWRPGDFGGLLFGFGSYAGTTTTGYTDWVADDGGEIRHRTRLEIADLTVAWVYHFGHGGVRPYAGAGGGFVWWKLSENGSFIDFDDPELAVFQARYLADGTTFEALALVGVDIPLTPAWRFFAEGRYRWADDDLADDYPPDFGNLDLSGYEISGGFAIAF